MGRRSAGARFGRAGRAAGLAAAAGVVLQPAIARAQGPAEVVLEELSVEARGAPLLREPVSGGGGPPLPGGFQASRPSSGILGNRSILQTPFSVQGFTETLIRDQQAQTAADVLRNDPSVTIQNTLGYFYDTFLIRGFQPGISNILYDGMTVGLLGKFQLEGIERLDIIKGPAAVLFGVGGFQGVGGVVNYAPKRPLPFDYTSVGTAFIAPGYTVTTADVSRTSADGRWGVRVNGAFGRGTFWSDTFLTHDVAQLTVEGRPSDSVRVFADFTYWTNLNDRDQLPFALAPGVAVPRAPNPKVNYQQRWNYTYNPGLLGLVKTEIDLNRDWTLTLAARSTYYLNDYLALIPTITNNAGAYTLNALGVRPTTTESFGGQAALTGKVETGILRHDIGVGFDAQSDVLFGGAVTSLGTFASNLFRPVYYPAPYQPIPRARRFNDTLARTGYVSDFVSLPGDVVQVLGAVRYIDIDFAAFDRATGASTGRSETAKAVPVGAVLVHPTPDTLVYASYAQGFERGGIAPLTAVNALSALPPVSSEQVEVGAKATLSGVTAAFAAFHIDRALEYVDAGTGRFVQNGRQVHDGLEFSLSGEPVEGVRLIGGLTFLDPVAEKTGNPLTDGKVPIGVPKFQASLYGEYDLPWLRGLTATGGVTYVDKEFYDLTNTRFIKPSTRFDVGLRYDTLFAGYRATFRLGVENLTDRYYWAAATTSGLALAAPRTIKASVQLRW